MPITVEQDVRKTVLDRIAANPIAGVEIAWPGIEYKPTPGVPWILPSYDIFDPERAVITGNSDTGDEYQGVISLQVHYPKNIGDNARAVLSDTVKGMFHNKRLTCGNTEIVCLASSPELKLEDGDWLVTTVSTDFTILVL